MDDSGSEFGANRNGHLGDRVVWQRYFRALVDAEIPVGQRKWFVRRVEEYLRATGKGASGVHRLETLDRYLTELSSSGVLLAWQFLQAREALRMFFVSAIRAEAAERVDWGRWQPVGDDRESAPGHGHDGGQEERRSLTSSRLKRRQLKEPGVGGEQPSPGAAGDRDSTSRVFHPYGESLRAMGTAFSDVLWRDSHLPHWAELDVKRFLEYLAVRRSVSVSTQNQALNALVFLFDQVMAQPLGELEDLVRARRSRRLPVVLTRDEVLTLLGAAPEPYQLMARLLYGSGLRLCSSACGCA